MSDTTDRGARIILRARALMANKGYGWSKAMSIARDLTGEDQPTDQEKPTKGRTRGQERPE